jgi:hypothetical protein
MGALSAEARGIVRRELAPVQARNDQVAAARMAALVGTYSARFNEGKRLTADQVNQLGKDVAECLHATISTEGRHFYGQSRPLRIARGDHSYRDTSLELRGADVRIARRRIHFWDYTLGLEFSFHCLGRIVERADVRSDLVAWIVENAIEALPYFVLLRTQTTRPGPVMVPFADGLLVADFMGLADIDPLIEYLSDRDQYGFIDSKAKTLWSSRGINKDDVVGFRVSTFLDFGILSPHHEELVREWGKMSQNCSDLWPYLALSALAPEKKNSPQILAGIQRLAAGFNSVVSSPAWRRSLESHREVLT